MTHGRNTVEKDVLKHPPTYLGDVVFCISPALGDPCGHTGWSNFPHIITPCHACPCLPGPPFISTMGHCIVHVHSTDLLGTLVLGSHHVAAASCCRHRERDERSAYAPCPMHCTGPFVAQRTSKPPPVCLTRSQRRTRSISKVGPKMRIAKQAGLSRFDY